MGIEQDLFPTEIMTIQLFFLGLFVFEISFHPPDIDRLTLSSRSDTVHDQNRKVNIEDKAEAVENG